MSKLSDNYPVGMSICDRNGINGNCGEDCELYRAGDCKVVNEEKEFNNKTKMSHSIWCLELEDLNLN